MLISEFRNTKIKFGDLTDFSFFIIFSKVEVLNYPDIQLRILVSLGIKIPENISLQSLNFEQKNKDSIKIKGNIF